jgi:zinc and cadmium transporter
MEIALSFVAGVILGVGLLHLLPHGFHELGSIDETMRWVLGGFLLMFFVERFFHFHHHGPPGELSADANHDHTCDTPHHDHAHVHAAHSGHSAGHGKLSWVGAGIGMTLHGAVEGIALAAAVTAEFREPPAAGHAPIVALAGLSAFLAIFLHKPFDSLTILTLMSASGASTGRRHLINAAYATVIPLGVLLYQLAFQQSGAESSEFLGRSLGFAAGTFLCIATSDLLPELQFHSHDRFKLSLALLLGLALAWALVYVEAAGHDHHDHHAAPVESSHEHHGH